jgi:hypothetical protein
MKNPMLRTISLTELLRDLINHKGQLCPYYNLVIRNGPLICQEGYCSECEIARLYGLVRN